MESQSYFPKNILKKKYLQYYDKPMDLFFLVYDTNLERDIRPKNDVGSFTKTWVWIEQPTMLLFLVNVLVLISQFFNWNSLKK